MLHLGPPALPALRTLETRGDKAGGGGGGNQECSILGERLFSREGISGWGSLETFSNL